MHFLKQNKKNLFIVSLLCIFAVIVFLHIYRLSAIPQTLYFDEVSIGYNAKLIAEAGKDEWGYRLPVYFKAFGEYKNPLYIYTSAFIFKVVNFTDYNLRLTSIFYFCILVIFTTLLIHKLFKSKTITIFGLLAVGFLPWYFTLSRIAFEVISQPAVYSIYVYLLYIIFSKGNKLKYNYFWHFLTGFILGLNIYTYSTSRLLVPSIFMVSILIWYSRKYVKGLIYYTLGLVLALIPFTVFTISNPGAITFRFKLISQWYDNKLFFNEKIYITLKNYFSYFSPDFLLIRGDLNLRHSIGIGGQVYSIVLLLAIIGGVILIFKYLKEKDSFILFLIISSLLVCIPASLTVDPMHSLRAALLGYYIIIISAYGLNYIQKFHERSLLTGFIMLVLVLQITVYLHNYFYTYSKVSYAWFNGPRFESDINLCLKQNPKKIVVYQTDLEPIYLNYYGSKSDKIVFTPSNIEKVDCIIN